MTSGNTPVSSFMTGVASAGIELMSSNANYQNKLRTFESKLAQNQTVSQSLAVTNQADAIVASGKAQADTYYAQGAQSFGSAALDLGNFARGAMDGEQKALQEQTESLANEVKEHTELLKSVDDRIKNPATQGPQTAVGNTDSAGPGKTDEQMAAEKNLDGSALPDRGNAKAEGEVLDLRRATPARDSNGNVIPNKTELDVYRKELQQKIDHKNEMINSKQQQISNMIQQRKMKFDIAKELVGGASSMFQAGYANEKAKQDAESTKWGFNKELGSNVFGAASAAMTDCNNQTDKMIDGITGALRHVVGG